MVPIPIHKEQPGYVLNSLLVPFLEAAENLVVNGIADFEMVDKTWMISTGAPKGPFAILDVIGINTPYNLSRAKAEAGDKMPLKSPSFSRKSLSIKEEKHFTIIQIRNTWMKIFLNNDRTETRGVSVFFLKLKKIILGAVLYSLQGKNLKSFHHMID